MIFINKYFVLKKERYIKLRIMKDMDMEKYSIKLDRDGGIHPCDVPASKLADLLRALSKQFAGSDDDFCLASMEDNCIRLDFSIQSLTVKANIAIFAALLAGENISSDYSVSGLVDLDRARARFGDVSITFPSVGDYPAVTIPPDRKLADMIKENINIRFQHTIYGTVMNAGGGNPNVHIRPIGGGNVVICDCSKELALEIAPMLYSVVGIVGEATKRGGTIRMKAHALLPYRKPLRNPFAILKESGVGKYFENESVSGFMQSIRENDGECNV